MLGFWIFSLLFASFPLFPASLYEPDALSIDSCAFVTFGNGVHRSPVKYANWNAGISSTISYVKHNISAYAMLQYSHLDDVELIYGFLDFSDQYQGLRVGRVQNTFGFYNKTHNIPYLSDWITPPYSIDPEIYRNLSTQIDGIQVYKYFNLGEIDSWEMLVTLSHGLAGLEPVKEAVHTHFNDSSIGKFIYDKSTISIADFNIVSPRRDFQFYINIGQLRLNFKSNFEPLIESGDAKTNIVLFGARKYFGERFDVTWEGMSIHSYGGPWQGVYSLSHTPHQQFSTELSARYRYDSRLSINVFVDLWCYERMDCEGAIMRKYTSSRQQYQRSIGIAFVYQFDHNIKAKFQFTYGEGEAWVYEQDNKQGYKDWNIAAFQLSKRF